MVRGADTDNAYGPCLDPNDLYASRLMGHRPKDFEYVSLLNGRFTNSDLLAERVAWINIHAAVSDQTPEELDYRRRASATWIAKSPYRSAPVTLAPHVCGYSGAALQGRLRFDWGLAR